MNNKRAPSNNPGYFFPIYLLYLTVGSSSVVLDSLSCGQFMQRAMYPYVPVCCLNLCVDHTRADIVYDHISVFTQKANQVRSVYAITIMKWILN
jgi:hypothetical protein